MVFGMILIGLLITAGILKPNPEGSGTHRQLGLPECSFKVMFDGKPCPSCGMTTSWSNLMRGRIIRSVQANVGGTLLGILALFVGPWFVISGWLARWWPGVPNEWATIGIAVAIFVITLGNWIIRLNV